MRSTPAASTNGPYVSSGDPYSSGELSVNTIVLKRCDFGAPAPLRIHTPVSPGTYAVVVFQHGFMALSSAYDEILRHLASHGFIVVVPQMYHPGIGALLGNPTADEEAVLASEILDWLTLQLNDAITVTARTDLLGIAGHSRGGKVAWLVLTQDSTRALAIAGVDPVDGRGGPGGNQPRVTEQPFAFSMPALIVGTELGGSCAPAGNNYVQFYAASQSPAWEIIALNQGHGDMLDEAAAEASAAVCNSGTDRPGMRRLTAGLLTAHFRGALQEDTAAFDFLTNTQGAPIPVTAQNK